MAQKSGGRGGGGGRSGGPAPFLIKTHQMVEEAASDDVISWGETGRSFVVWKPVEFARDLLPLHFKHNNFSSFVRQLNTYRFRKVVPDRWEFANEYFLKGEPNLLTNIRRRKTSPANSLNTGKSNNNAQSSPPLALPPRPPSSATTSSTTSSPLSPSIQDLTALTYENEQLKKDNQTLNTELAIAKRRCDKLLGFLSQFVNVRELDFRILMGENDAKGVKKEIGEEESGGEIKLFGVSLRGNGSRKRGFWGESEMCGAEERPMKMGFPPVRQNSGKVCN